MKNNYFSDKVKKPCPFCGSNELIGWHTANPNYSFVVECKNCITQFGFSGHVAASALELWDGRREIETQTFNDALDLCIKLLNDYKKRQAGGASDEINPTNPNV